MLTYHSGDYWIVDAERYLEIGTFSQGNEVQHLSKLMRKIEPLQGIRTGTASPLAHFLLGRRVQGMKRQET